MIGITGCIRANECIWDLGAPETGTQQQHCNTGMEPLNFEIRARPHLASRGNTDFKNNTGFQSSVEQNRLDAAKIVQYKAGASILYIMPE